MEHENNNVLIYDAIQVSPGWFLFSTEEETALVDRATLRMLLKQLLQKGRST